MDASPLFGSGRFSRRALLQAAGGTAASVSLCSHPWLAGLAAAQPAGAAKKPAVVRAAFVYPPTETLRKAGYYSWPGSTFDAEGRQKQYTAALDNIQRKLGMRIVATQEPLNDSAGVTAFINEVKADPPEALFLVPFKKGHWPHVTRIVEETKLPAVVLAPLGVLLVGMVRELHRTPGVYLVNSLDNFEAVERGCEWSARPPGCARASS